MSVKSTTVPPKSLSQAILSSASTFILSDIKGWDGNDLTAADFGTQAFGAFLSADRTKLELFEFDPATIAAGSITILYRGLKFDGTQTTEVAANKLDWAAGTTVMIGTDTPQLIELMVANVGDETIAGVKTFTSSPIVPTPTTATQAANKSYIDGVAIAGAAKATETVYGIAKLSTAAVDPLIPIVVGDNDARVPTTGENNALVGNNTDIAVGTGNKFVTQTGLQHNAEKYAADAGSDDTYVITLDPVPTSYTNGMVVHFKANTVNTGAATLNVNSLGAKTIVKYVNTTLANGDIAAGQFCTVIYDGTNFVLQNPVANVVTNPTFTVNADETLNTYDTFQMPMIKVSATALNAWASVTVVATSDSASVLNMAGSGSADFTVQALLPGTGSNFNYRYDDNKIIRIKARLKIGDTSDRKGFGLAITPAHIHTAETDVSNGEIRFVFNTTALWAQNANGTATKTDISSGITLTNWNLYEIVFTPGVDIKYYVNGTLKATHTTNLPTTGTPGITYGANANGRVVGTTFPVVSIQI